MNIIRKQNVFLTVSALLLTVICVFWILSTHTEAKTITETLNLVNVTQNERGDGYYWANRTDVLTLDGLRLETTSDYGLRLPQNCTVELKGTNYIKAGKYALTCSGNVSFKGSGKLILDGGEMGIYIYTEVNTHKIRLLGGEYEIRAGKYGICSTHADFSFVDGDMDIEITDPAGAAIFGRCVNLVGGDFEANGSVEATHELVVQGIDIDIESTRAALSAKTLTIKDISKPDYSGEYEIEAESTAKRDRRSAIFGDDVPGYVDVLLLIGAVAVIALLVIIPILRRRKKTKELYERLAKEGK